MLIFSLILTHPDSWGSVLRELESCSQVEPCFDVFNPASKELAAALPPQIEASGWFKGAHKLPRSLKDSPSSSPHRGDCID